MAPSSPNGGATPTITGTAQVGQVLTGAAGTWTPAPVTLAWQWLRNGTAISGATASTYTVTTADIRATLSVMVTGTKTGYLPTSLTSASTATVVLPGGIEPVTTAGSSTPLPGWAPRRRPSPRTRTLRSL